jgi:CelD/BcsL family acetyltransferase involved in cellulose biosynthesis
LSSITDQRDRHHAKGVSTADAARPVASLTAVAGGACRVRVARTVAQVEELRDVWTSLLGDSIHTDPDYFLWSLREPHVIRPHVLVVERDGVVESIVVARIADARLPCKVGQRTLYAPRARGVCVMREGWLGRADAYTAEVILDELTAALDRREGDVLLFRQLEHASVLHRAALARASFGTRRQHFARTNVHWLVDLKPTVDEYLSSVSTSTRKSVRRTANRVESTYGDRLSIRLCTRADELDEFLASVESVAARTYQRRLGVGYLGDERQVARIRLLAREGWFRGYLLHVDGRPVAFELGELYRGRFHSLAGAYDPDYGCHRVGAYLLLKVFEDLGSAARVTTFDFGFGDADYKAKLSQRSLQEGDLVVYARRPRPLWIGLARTAVLELSSAVTRGLRRLALLHWIQQRRRRPQALSSPTV